MTTASRIGKLHLPDGIGPLTLTRMTAVERISEPFTVVIDATSATGPVNLHPALTKMVGVEFDANDFNSRWFHGILWEYVELGPAASGDQFSYRLTLRPGVLLWTQNQTSIIHYKKSITDLITENAGPWKTVALTGTYDTVEYRVQYGESKFDFLTRNLEKEGIYYYYVHEDGKHTIVFADAINHHTAMTPATVFLGAAREKTDEEAVLTSLVERRTIAPTRYSVDDYDYDAPTVGLKKDKVLETLGAPPPRFNSGTADLTAAVAGIYEYPGRFDNPTIAAGTRYAERWLEREQRRMARSFAEGTLFAAAVGKTIKIDYGRTITANAGEDAAANDEFLIVATTHRYTGGDDRSGAVDESLTVELELMPATKQYRPARMTPIPKIYGPQTAIVVGPSGEEIYTDKYGRVKLKFFWDKETPSDDTGSIWVRVGQSGAGSGFGSFMVPRIGHEVIVEFLEGDPDRPIITGAVYNGSNLPAFGTAADNTIQGIRTNSSKGGGGYNEIKIDDKKDSELFSLHAQKDLKWVVDKGDETRDLLNGNRTTVIHKGDETMTVTAGKRTTTIKGDEATTIQSGNVTHEVTAGDVTRTIKAGKRTTEMMGDDVKTIKSGGETTTIKMGDREATVSMGNDKLTVSMGDVDIKVSLGNHKTEALQSIELKCGGSSFKMDPMSITLKSMMIKIEADVMLQTKGLMVQQEASALHIVKGGIVLIN
nr:type VI secretion system tip protein TssI/VgrG [Polymorphobacter sp.]